MNSLRFFFGTLLIASISHSFAHDINRQIGRERAPLVIEESGNFFSSVTMLLIDEDSTECDIDTVAPVATCVDSKVVSTSPFDCTAPVLATMMDAGSWDACSPTLDFRINLTDTLIASPFEQPQILSLGLGDYDVTIWVIDMAGNWSTCASTITVLDQVKPVAICDDDVTVSLNDHGEFILYANDIDEGSWDNCGSVDLSIEFWPTSTIPPTSDSIMITEPGVVTVNLWAVDESGNSNYCWIELVVLDTTTTMATFTPSVLPLYIYPNPFSNQFWLLCEDGFDQIESIRLTDIFGHKMISISDFYMESKNTIKCSATELPSGLYFLQFDTMGKHIISPILKN